MTRKQIEKILDKHLSTMAIPPDEGYRHAIVKDCVDEIMTVTQHPIEEELENYIAEFGQRNKVNGTEIGVLIVKLRGVLSRITQTERERGRNEAVVILEKKVRDCDISEECHQCPFRREIINEIHRRKI